MYLGVARLAVTSYGIPASVEKKLKSVIAALKQRFEEV